mmetsp:Transcript_8574/g.18770  ORF Transcript_8574/g.18770 Transcript_8574/m.18770 type:complete len:283 (+) Transcript_8574:100-948(+)
MTEGFDFTHSQDFAALAASFGMADDGGAAAAMAYGAMAGGGGGGNRFNPMGGGSQKAGMNSKGLPLNPGQQPCSFYMRRGECKFGETCRFDHPEPGPGGGPPGATLNSAGYPLNEGQTDCGFYMKTGACKFGATCRFNHPEGVATSHASQQTGPFPAKGGQGGMGMMAGMGMGGGMLGMGGAQQPPPGPPLPPGVEQKIQQALEGPGLASLCPGADRQAVAVGEACWKKVWAYVGCQEASTPPYEEWHNTQSLEVLVADAAQWASLPSQKHRAACYGLNVEL